MEKMFIGYGACPYTGNAVDSSACRQCKWYIRPGTHAFILCSHPQSAKETTRNEELKNKKTSTYDPVIANKRAKGNSGQIKGGTIPKKRGRPKKAK